MKSALSAVILLLYCAYSLAHDTNSSYTSLEVDSSHVQLTLTFDLTDLSKAFELDSDHDGGVDRDELMTAMPKMYDYFGGHHGLALGFTPVELEKQEGGFFQDEIGNIFINFIFTHKLVAMPAEIGFNLDVFEKFGEQHKNLAKVVHGEVVQQAVFTIEAPRKRFALSDRVSLWAQLQEFTELGVEHIFLGYDHIMFLLGLIIIGGRFLDLVKIVSAFTVAHSITLILAALQVVTLPSRMIESGIALSIAYVAVENFLILSGKHVRKDDRALRDRWVLTFFFGLVHGFGFANVLRDLGLPARALVGSLLAFNGGAEIGQMIIVATMFPLVLWIAASRFQRQFVYGLSAIILAFGVSWFVERTFALQFMPF